MAMHLIQGPLISMRIVDNSEVSDPEPDMIRANEASHLRTLLQ